MLVAGSPMVLIANPALGVRTVPQLIELAKSKPNQLNYASSGSGAITHLGAVRLMRMVGIELAHVPFKGSIPATSSVIAGETAVAFSTIPAAVPQAKAGRLNLLAVSFAKRSPQLPDVPTIAETVGEFDLGLYSGLWAPAGTPRAIIDRLYAEFTSAMEQPRVKDILAVNSAEPGRMNPAQFGEYVAREIKLWGEVVRDAPASKSINQREQQAMDMGIKGRAALVTGGSRGIGRETARQFLEEGVRVMICGRNAETLERTRAELAQATGGEIHATVADMTKEADIARLVDAAKQRFGTIDILVNNAGQMYSGRFAVMNDAGLKEQLETKLFGFLRAIRLVYPMMKERRWGRIVNLIGGAGKEPDPYMFGSGITNSALLNITKSLSTEFGEDGVLVNAVCPGWVDTNLWQRNAQGLAAELNTKSEEEARRLAARKNSLNRFGKPEELANAIVFLCSERASYITGVSLNLDGGRLKSLW